MLNTINNINKNEVLNNEISINGAVKKLCLKDYQETSIKDLKEFLGSFEEVYFTQEEINKLYEYNQMTLKIDFTGDVKNIKKTHWHNAYNIFCKRTSNRHILKLRKVLFEKYKKSDWELERAVEKDNRKSNYEFFKKDVIDFYIDFFGIETIKKIIKSLKVKGIFRRLKENILNGYLKRENDNINISISKLDLFSKMGLLDNGKANRIFLTLPTGAGKTTVISELLKNYTDNTGKKDNKKINFIVYKDDLLLQSVLSFNKAGINPAINKAKVKEITKQGGIIDLESNIFIGNIQGKTPEADIIIIDEAHRTGATGYENYLLKNINKMIIGMSATPYRNDGKTMYSYYKKEINPYTLAEHLTSPETPTFKYNICKQNININAKFSEGDTEDFRMISEYSDYDLDKVLWLFEKTQNQSNLIFTDKVANAVIINRYLKKKGFKSAFIVGSDELMNGQGDNQEETNVLEIIKQFKSKGINFLISVNKLLYGTDCPNTDNLIIFRPTRSINLFTQMLGRGLRLGATQEVNVYDCCNLIEIQNKLEHFDLFFTRTGHNYNFYNSIEKIDRWESYELRQLATRDYATESKRPNNNYIIDKYASEEQEKYFIIKYKKYNSTKFYNCLKGNDLSIRARQLKVFKTYCRDGESLKRFEDKNKFMNKDFKIVGKIENETGSFDISYTTNEKDQNVIDFLQDQKNNLDAIKNALTLHHKNDVKFYNEKTFKKPLSKFQAEIKQENIKLKSKSKKYKYTGMDLFEYFNIVLSA